MAIFAKISVGIITALQVLTMSDGSAPAVPAGMTDVSAFSGQCEIGASIAGTTCTYVAPTPTLAQQAQAALASCALSVTSSGTPTLSANYPCDSTSQAKIAAVVTAITATGAFPGGASVYPMKDTNGTWHSFTPIQYVQVAGAIATYVGQLDLIVDGNPIGASVLPSATAVIP